MQYAYRQVLIHYILFLCEFNGLDLYYALNVCLLIDQSCSRLLDKKKIYSKVIIIYKFIIFTDM